MRIRFDSVGTQLISGSMLGAVLGAQLYVMQTQAPEPAVISAQNTECYQSVGPGEDCPSGWIPIGGGGCYADGTTTCTCENGDSGLCGAGACLCLPCDLNTGGPCSASAISVATMPCGAGQITCGTSCCDFDTQYCNLTTETCVDRATSSVGPPPPPSSANPPSSGAASSPC